MTIAALQQIRQAQFEAAWYYSIIVAAMLAFLILGAAWGIAGGVRIWRRGDREAGALISIVSSAAALIFIGMLIAGAVALVRTGGTG